SPESIVLFGGELWWDYDRDLYYEASAADVSTADSFPKLPNAEPDFLGNYAWAGMGSEEYLVVDSTYLHAGTYYTSNGVVPKNLPGAVYDKASNTLTLENFHGSFIDANLMGNGFKVKLVGSNSLDTIKMWGAMYGGSITFTGDGSITLNQELKYDSGLYLECENSPSAVLIDREATVEVYGEAAVMIHATQLETAVYTLNPIVMTGGRYADGEFVKYRVNVTDSAGNIVFDEDGNPVLTDWTVKDIAREQGIDLYDYSIVGTDGEPSGHVLFRPIKE
ncbi:MAG: hypothetical protein IK088_00785, partial [Lachnospiraceae bacterium]|nr:hypothetical protein [Lachnospiraceae bacterium]